MKIKAAREFYYCFVHSQVQFGGESQISITSRWMLMYEEEDIFFLCPIRTTPDWATFIRTTHGITIEKPLQFGFGSFADVSCSREKKKKIVVSCVHS